MTTTSLGIRLDDATRERLAAAARRLDRTPQWLVRQAVFDFLEQLDNAGEIIESRHLDTAEEEAALNIEQASRSCALRLPPLIAAPNPKPYRCCWNRPDLLQTRPQRRIAWPCVSQQSCATAKVPADARGWCKVCCRSFRYLPRKAWR